MKGLRQGGGGGAGVGGAGRRQGQFGRGKARQFQRWQVWQAWLVQPLCPSPAPFLRHATLAAPQAHLAMLIELAPLRSAAEGRRGGGNGGRPPLRPGLPAPPPAAGSSCTAGSCADGWRLLAGLPPLAVVPVLEEEAGASARAWKGEKAAGLPPLSGPVASLLASPAAGAACRPSSSPGCSGERPGAACEPGSLPCPSPSAIRLAPALAGAAMGWAGWSKACGGLEPAQAARCCSDSLRSARWQGLRMLCTMQVLLSGGKNGASETQRAASAPSCGSWPPAAAWQAACQAPAVQQQSTSCHHPCAAIQLGKPCPRRAEVSRGFGRLLWPEGLRRAYPVCWGSSINQGEAGARVPLRRAFC